MEATSIATEMMNGLNCMNNKSFCESFVNVIKNDHRTLQQCFMRDIVLRFIEKEASSEYYDKRNEATHNLCVKIKEMIDEENINLPFI